MDDYTRRMAAERAAMEKSAAEKAAMQRAAVEGAAVVRASMERAVCVAVGAAVKANLFPAEYDYMYFYGI